MKGTIKLKKRGNKNLRIAMIGHKVVPSRRGGIERVLTIMCPLMIKKGHQVTCFNRSGDKVENEYVKTVKRKKYRGVQLKKVITINKRGLAAMTSSFSAAICAAFGKYDVVHFHAEGPSAFLWIPKLFGKRCIVTIHGIDWARDKWKHGFGSRYIKFGEYIAAKYADEVIVLSEKVQKYFKKFYDRDTVLIPNGVMTHENQKADLITKKFGLHKDEYICALSRLTEEKGIGTLIDVCKLLPDVPFIFAGTGPLEDQIEGIPNIKNVGFQTGKDLEKLIREARFSIYPSEWYENCPFSVMESQMYGTPVLGANIGGIPELIQEGKTGELFESADAVDLKEKIKHLWEDKELTASYTDNCKDISFDTIDEYYEKLMKIYTGRVRGNRAASKQKGKLSEKNMSKDKKVKKLNGTVIVTYRCNARCNMCNRYKKPSTPDEEISLETIKKLPPMYFTNITGGEPFIRTDLKDIVRELQKKSDRIVISTNGFFTDRIVDLCKEFPNVGIRISIEGLEETNNKIRGLENGFQRGYTTLKKLRQMGMKDVGFGMTVQDANCKDLVPLYKISDKMGMEFATASLHNSFYFVEAKNIIKNRPMVAKQFENLVNELLNSNSPKKWFRAYFNHGLINYIYGQKRLLPCDMSFDTFFIDPYGDVMPCNGTKDKEVMGNLNEQSWNELWNSKEAEKVRKKVRCCDRDCWMIGSVSPAMHKYIWVPALWVMKHKFLRFFKKKKYSMYENKIVRDYKKGIVTKEELDKCSTCDMCATINDGLSAASKEQLVGKSGEEIVDADIAKQMEK